MKKRFIACATAVAMLVVTGCSKKNETTTKSDSLRVFNGKVEIDQQLKAFASMYEEKTGVHVEVESIGGGADIGATLKGYKASDNMPDTFMIAGPADYEMWKEDMVTLDDQPWVKETKSAYTADGHVYGFPYAVEGYGLAYNPDLLAKAGIDPASLTTIDAYEVAFKKLDSMKADLGITSVVSMACSASGGMTWVTGNHNVGVYLSTGLKAGDTHVIDDMLAGKVEKERLAQYADWVKLLFEYSDPVVLTTGGYDQQVGAFADSKTVFCHQGNWIDGNLTNASFKAAFAPQAFSHEVTDGIQVGAPSWWCVTKGGNEKAAKAFLTSFALSDEGRKARITDMSMISPYTSDTLKPTTPLSESVQEWVVAGKTYPWEQYKMPDGFGMNTLGPIYELLANNTITTDQFCQMFTDAVATISAK
jgi:raffinose/stachyose/melibiose transport system substrate-binding protein